MIQLNKLNKSYQTFESNLHVLKDIELTVNKGDFVSLMGASGSGKSTLLNILGLLDNPDTGEYLLDNSLVSFERGDDLAGLRNQMIGFVFQSFNLIPYKTAIENIILPLFYRNTKDEEAKEQAMHLLEKVGMVKWAHHLPNQLSGGQKQRIAIARALITNPKVILADEPTGALDSKTSYQVMELLQGLNDEGNTIVMVTHEEDIANMSKRIVRLKDGNVISEQSFLKVS